MHEHQATLPGIKTFMQRRELWNFLASNFHHVERHFRGRFPDTEALTDLDVWHIFETGNPRVFAGMCEFLIAKP